MHESIVLALEKIVSKYPDKVAIAAESNRYTYHDLWSEIIACSNYVRALNIKTGERVAILLSNSFQYVVAYYGIIASGGVVVALNTSASVADVRNWCAHSNASMLITESDFMEDASQLDCIDAEKLLNLKSGVDTGDHSYWRRRLPVAAGDWVCDVQGSDGIASIIYTSGTTGTPKGVTLSHLNLTSNFFTIIKYLNLSSNDSIINILPFYYSYGNSILHTHLLSGATLYLENSFMYPVKVLNKMAEFKVTGFSGVPATYSILLNRTRLEEYDLSSLRYVTQAGGAMPAANIEKLQKHLPDARIFIMYGQTEATARITYLDPQLLHKKLGSIGKPLDGLTVEIRDENGIEVAARIEGQLYVSGPSIMHGYWADSKLTDSVIHQGYLKTGDIGYRDDEGFIYLTGRLSDMIKVGGNRISPLEVEEVITRLNGVEEVAASGVDDELLGQVVKVSIVRSTNSNLTELQVKAYCRQQLAQYKIPKFIEFIESLPKTSSGKVKRYML